MEPETPSIFEPRASKIGPNYKPGARIPAWLYLFRQRTHLQIANRDLLCNLKQEFPSLGADNIGHQDNLLRVSRLEPLSTQLWSLVPMLLLATELQWALTRHPGLTLQQQPYPVSGLLCYLNL